MDTKKHKILIVDDSSTMRRIIKNTLMRLGFEHLIEAENGLEAWTTISKYKVDVLITDWNMPVMSGLELVKRVRAEEKYNHVPIIMITTEGGKSEVITALKAGVNNYIVKPFTPQVLNDKLSDVLFLKD